MDSLSAAFFFFAAAAAILISYGAKGSYCVRVGYTTLLLFMTCGMMNANILEIGQTHRQISRQPGIQLLQADSVTWIAAMSERSPKSSVSSMNRTLEAIRLLSSTFSSETSNLSASSPAGVDH